MIVIVMQDKKEFFNLETCFYLKTITRLEENQKIAEDHHKIFSNITEKCEIAKMFEKRDQFSE